MDYKEIIINKINEIIKEFPLKPNAEISSEKKLFEIINIFNSILAERIKAKLYDYFPSVSFEKLTEFSTFQEIYELVLDSKEESEINNIIENSNKVNKDLEINRDNTKNYFEFLTKSNQSLGIDIEKRDSINESIFDIKLNSFRKKTFTTNELIYSISKPDPILTLTGIYSAKESIKKALGCDQKINYQDININHNRLGKPYAIVLGYDSNQFLISISHTDELVISACIFNN